MRLIALAALLSLSACQTLPAPPPDTVSRADTLNAYRSGVGHAPLRRDPRLDAAARAHAADMARHGFMAHRGSDGSTHEARIRRSGYPYCGAAENIAKGPYTAGSVMAAWWDSPGHRANMRLDRVRDYGLAQVGDAWVMVLARPC